jgi:dihydrofolate reductase
MPRPTLSLIAAVSRDGGLGHAGELLVRIPEDLRRLKRLTLGSAVIMGRATWDSIGRPLPGRDNIVVTRNRSWHAEGAQPAATFEAALASIDPARRAFVLGGASIYALALPLADALELTEVDAVYPADTFFPPWNRAEFRQTSREAHETADGLRYSFVTYQRIA